MQICICGLRLLAQAFIVAEAKLAVRQGWLGNESDGYDILQRADCRSRPLQSVAGAAGVGRHPPVHRLGICLEPIQRPANAHARRCCQRRRGLEPLASSLDFHGCDRVSGAGGGLWRTMAGAGGGRAWLERCRRRAGVRLSCGSGRHPHPAAVLLYLGYGVLGGCGLGLGYVSPVSTLLRWFPDRRGMATGLAIMGFGGGAIIAAPLKEFLIRAFYRAPEYLGDVAAVGTGDDRGPAFRGNGQRPAGSSHRGGPRRSADDRAGPEGVYLVGTGSVGILATFIVLGVALFRGNGSGGFRLPHSPPAGSRPAGLRRTRARQKSA